MFDFMKMFGGGAGGGMSNMFAKPQGWGATVTPTDSLFSRDAASGGITGINGSKVQGAFAAGLKGAGAGVGVGKGLGGFSAGMEAGGGQGQPAMAPPPDPNADPNITNAQAFYQAIQARRGQQGRY